MKKDITLRLCIVVVLSMFVIALMSYYLQIKTAKEAMYTNSIIRMNQISQILENNETDIVRLKENLKADYFIRAKAAAYIVQKNQEVIGNLEETRKIAALLRVDELHLFDPDGVLFAGTEPQYFNYTFNSGEQMQFFLPMLENNSLELCQDVVPNTAEHKLMQYIAVWREDHQGIIQIGMKPVRLLEAMEKNEISHIFTMVTAEKDLTIFAIDPETGIVLGSTNDALVGLTPEALGFALDQTAQTEVNIEIEGQKNYCLFQPANQVILGVSSTYESLYRNLEYDMLLVVVSLFILSFIIIILILRLLDKYILNGIVSLTEGMKLIADGDLDFHINVDDSPEFVELSANINEMVVSLLETTGKLSLVFQNVNIPIAVYEYNKDMKRVLATSKIGEILGLPQEEIHRLLSDRCIFADKICKICNCPFEQEKDVYVLGEKDRRYVKIKFYKEKNKTLGILVDVTEEIEEKQRIRYERDVDLLTGLSSRRALFKNINKIVCSPGVLRTAAILMVDMDNLKFVNDNWGHECGDVLLKKAAELLMACEAPNKLTARLSGDEFVLMIYGEDSEEKVQRYIDKLYERITGSVIQVADQAVISVCMSGGYVFFPSHRADYKEILHLADQTMYRVKKGNKGHFERYSQPDLEIKGADMHNIFK